MSSTHPRIADADPPVRLSLPKAFTDRGAPRSGPRAVFFVRKDLDDVPSLVSLQPDQDFWEFETPPGPPDAAQSPPIPPSRPAPASRPTPASPQARPIPIAPVRAPGLDESPDLAAFFGPAGAAPPSAPTTGPWPGHNYGEAYESMRENLSVAWARHIETARQRTRRPAELWEVEEVAPPPGAEAAHGVRPEPAALSGSAWLEGLAGEPARVAMSEARIHRLLGPTPAPSGPLLDACDVLQARPRPSIARIPAAVLPEETPLWRDLSGLVGSGVLVVLILMFLQLVFF